ncbi:MAG: OmpA family protein [candidate division WOR-3 bacterium]
MKAAVKITTILMGIAFVLILVGCPKKCVKPVAEEPVVVEPPEEEEVVPSEKPRVQLDLQTIYFDFDKSDIRPGDAQILQSNASKIKNVINSGQKVRVTIEGHCCPIGTSEYNMALGQRRAESARKYLINLGIPADILNTISYGEERLVTTDSAQYHLNRRCEFKSSSE